MNATIAEEHFAKLIAFWHGQKLIRTINGSNHTVAAIYGYGQWSDAYERYANAHWGEYISAARAVIEQRQL